MEIILIRHGLPEHVDHGDGADSADPALTAEGLDQANRLARWFERQQIHTVISSPMRRARQTAAPLAAAFGLEIEEHPGVVEFDKDSKDYIPAEKMKELDYERWQGYTSGRYGEGVDFNAFADTVVESIEGIIAANRGRRVAVVCHGGVINVWTARVLGFDPRMFFVPGYTSVNRYMAASSGERTLVSLNETAHLPV